MLGTYGETTNSLSVAYDGNRLILNDLELRQQFPNAADYPAAPPTSMLGPSFVSGGQQVFEFVRMMARNEVYLCCAQLANASRVLGNLGDDDGRFMALRGPVTLRHMHFRLTDLDGNVVRLRGSSLSFVLYLDHV